MSDPFLGVIGQRQSSQSALKSALSTSPTYRPSISHAQLEQITATLAEHAEDLDRTAEFPHRNLALLQQHGLLGLSCAPGYGGAGADLVTLQRVISAIAQGEPSTALIVCMQYLHHLRLAENPLWPEALRQQVCQSAVQQGALINSLRVEPELGSPARGGLPNTLATRSANGWKINGHKLYTTGIEGLTWLAIWARSDEITPQVGIWLVPRHSAGIRVIESWDHLGMRASGSHEVVLEDVEVPLNHAVDTYPIDHPPSPDSEKIRSFANQNAALLSAVYDGVAQSARNWLLSWLQQRVPSGLGKPLASLSRVQEIVGKIEALLLVNQSLLQRVATQGLSSEQANLAKVTITENAIEVVSKSLELTGNHGLSRHHPLERHYRNVLCGRVHTPQNDSAWINAGKQALTAHLNRPASASKEDK